MRGCVIIRQVQLFWRLQLQVVNYFSGQEAQGRVPNGILLQKNEFRDETNFVITRNKVVLSRNSVLGGMAYFVLRNGTKRNEIT
jgi:hypothetical protein